MIRNILTQIGGAAVICLIAFLAGAHWEADRNKAEYERQVAELNARIVDADKARADLKRLNDTYLAKIGELANAPAPANSNTAFDAEAAKRIGAIR